MAYDNIKGALGQAEASDYGIVAPKLSEMILEKPEVFKQGNKYGVRMKAKAPCLHIIKTNISTEVSPVVGTESQSIDLAQSLTEQFENGGEDIWGDQSVRKISQRNGHRTDGEQGKRCA